MNDDHNAAYVHQALLLHGYELSDEQEAGVVAQFAGIAAIAAVLMREELDLALEPAPVFLP
jgi:murein L,D-transpeptidase YafK